MVRAFKMGRFVKGARWAPLLALGFLFGCVSMEEYDAKVMEARKLRSTMDVLEGENRELRKVLDQWMAAYKRVEGDLKAAGPGTKERLASLEKELEGLRARTGKLEGEVTRLENEARTLREDRDALAEGLRIYRTRLSQATERVQHLERKSTVYERLEKALERELAEGKVRISEIEGRLKLTVLDRILFPLGSAEINEEGKGVLKRMGQILKGVEGKRIHVEGHTDNIPVRPTAAGRFRDNWELSTLRATTVVRYLETDAGIDPTLLSAVGYGQYQPVASNGTPEGRQQNRRIEIVLTPLPVRRAEEKPADASPGGAPPSGR